MIITITLIFAVIFLSYSNGANDNFKGVATLFGSKISSYKIAVNWATIATGLGAITSIFLAEKLVKNFSGKKLVPDELFQDPSFAIAVAIGAAITVFIATRIGMPVSTTHGLVGALTGAGVLAVGSQFGWSHLGKTFFLPLILSPLVALLASILIYWIFTNIRKGIGLESKMMLINNKSGGNEVYVYEGAVAGVSAQGALTAAHFVSSGVVCFARGLNDTPKIVGLLFSCQVLGIQYGCILVGGFMLLGGLINAKKVAETMSEKITPMNNGQGFSANLVTGVLVICASYFALPVSTTHVSVGSILGIGTVTKNANWKVIRSIGLSWLLTLPVACVMGAAAYGILRLF